MDIKTRSLTVELQKEIIERKKAEEEIKHSVSLLDATLESTADGILVVDREGKIEKFNRKFVQMWRIPESILASKDVDRALAFALDQLKDPEVFLKKVRGLYNLPEAESYDVLEFKDGRVFERYLQPQRIGDRIIGRVSSFRDVTERKWMEQTLIRSEEVAKRLSQENAIMAEIGRIISSTLNIEEIYERFAEEVRKLIPFDRIVINTFNIERGTLINVYMAGGGIEDRKVGEVYPLQGSGNAEMVRTNSTLLVQTEDFNEYKDRFPMLLSTFQAGFRSIMNVPLFSKGRIIGGLLLRSFKPYAYTDKDVRLTERIGDQIAGAIVNALLFAEQKRTEEALERSEKEAQRFSQENAIIAKIGQIISSTLDIDEVYSLFAEEVRKLIPFDRISVATINSEVQTVTMAYTWGNEIDGRNQGDVFPIENTTYAKLVVNRSGILIQVGSEDELKAYPHLLNTFRAGFRSMISVPLISKDEMIGGLNFRSIKPNNYTEFDLNLAEKVGHQIAGAIANAQLFIERKQAEEALRQSEEKYRTILENIEDGYLEVDLAGNFTFVNDAECRNLGYTKEELIGMSNRQYTDETTARKLYQIFNVVYRTGEPVKVLDVEVIRKDGIKVINAISVSLIRDSEGKPIGFRSIARDITERKRTEEEKEKLILHLQKALAEVKQLSGLLPICASCKKIRDDKGYWSQIETYIRDRSEAEFTHGICPDCFKKLYPDIEI